MSLTRMKLTRVDLCPRRSGGQNNGKTDQGSKAASGRCKEAHGHGFGPGRKCVLSMHASRAAIAYDGAETGMP